MQSIQILKKDRNLDELELQSLNRTFWACFVIDRLIFCGKSQPLALPIEKMRIHLPVGKLDFAFGKPSSSLYTISDLDHDARAAELHGNIDHCYSVLIRGIEVCAKIFEWVINGGRRQQGMAKQENCPWMTNSPWNILSHELESWRSQQSPQLHYPLNKMSIYISLGYGESAAFVILSTISGKCSGDPDQSAKMLTIIKVFYFLIESIYLFYQYWMLSHAGQ